MTEAKPTASATPPESTKEQLRDKCCLTCDASAFKDPTKQGFCRLKPPIVTAILVPTGLAPPHGPPVAAQDFTLWPCVQPTDFCVDGYVAKGTQKLPFKSAAAASPGIKN